VLADRQGGRVLERLEDHAVALGQLDQRVHLLGRRVGVQLEAQADVAKAHGRILGDAQGAAAVDVAFGKHRGIAQFDAHRGGHRLHRHAGAGHQGLEQHVA